MMCVFRSASIKMGSKTCNEKIRLLIWFCYYRKLAVRTFETILIPYEISRAIYFFCVKFYYLFSKRLFLGKVSSEIDYEEAHSFAE